MRSTPASVASTSSTGRVMRRSTSSGVNVSTARSSFTFSSRIDVAFKEAEKTKRPVAVLVGDEYHGFVAK